MTTLGVQRAVVVSVSGGGKLFATVDPYLRAAAGELLVPAALAPTRVDGVWLLGAAPAVGARVIVGCIDGSIDDLVLLAVL